MMVLAVIILGAAIKQWVSVLSGGPVPATAEQGVNARPSTRLTPARLALTSLRAGGVS